MPRASCPIPERSDAVKGSVGVPNRRSSNGSCLHVIYRSLPVYVKLGSFKPDVGVLSTTRRTFLEGVSADQQAARTTSSTVMILVRKSPCKTPPRNPVQNHNEKNGLAAADRCPDVRSVGL